MFVGTPDLPKGKRKRLDSWTSLYHHGQGHDTSSRSLIRSSPGLFHSTQMNFLRFTYGLFILYVYGFNSGGLVGVGPICHGWQMGGRHYQPRPFALPGAGCKRLPTTSRKTRRNASTSTQFGPSGDQWLLVASAGGLHPGRQDQRRCSKGTHTHHTDC